MSGFKGQRGLPGRPQKLPESTVGLNVEGKGEHPSDILWGPGVGKGGASRKLGEKSLGRGGDK